ncbi:DUF4968 domain-containing protein [Adhaeribacter radiodurans]|uniref:DUF4968 domain-containing protein n=2 Tax=Adhaeribacter radiodurans TaxID=2745197 RepID=A0A7L7LFL6_9BACT|nr:DUF4968 domain-containing protein [Adhaeribacter radiodurans]
MINDLANRKGELFPGTIIDCQYKNNNFYFYCDNNVILHIKAITDKVIRFRYAVDGDFEKDFSYAVAETYQPEKPTLEFKEKTDHYRITTNRIIITIWKENLSVRILDKSGTVLIEDERGFHWEYNRETGNNIVKISKKVQSGEHYYGLGDKSSNMNLRGRRVENWGSDTYGYGKNTDPLYKNIPFYIGLHQKIAYGMFFDNSFRSFFDFAAERSNVTSYWAHGGELNYYFIYGPKLVEVTEQYTCLTGKPELPPLWVLGYHQCKWSYYPEEKVKEIAAGFRDRQIPCDALYLDIDYMEGFRCFTWSKEYFPNPKRMLQELAQEGFKTVVIIDPGIKIDKDYWVYQEGIENDYFCHRADGPLMKGSVWPGLCNFPDFTRPDVREWWADLFKGLLEVGVKGVWNDMNEPAVFEQGTFPDDVRFDYDGHPCSHKKAHNIYGMQMARATYMGVKKYAYPNRPFTITRSGYSGVQRFASTWTGDNIASWEHMWLANIQCQRLSISGYSFAGSDIGGFIETPSGELYIRWLALGVFHPFCRTHSSGDHGDQEPWSFGEENTALAKKFIQLRYQFMPYMYTTFWQYVTKGTPMLKPLVYLDQYDSETYLRMAEFGLGDNLLVCPITQPEADGRWLYLPRGNWYYYWTDELVAGGKEIWANAGLDRIPLYVQAGAVIPMFPVLQYVGEKEIEELTLHVYHKNGAHESTLFEDAGEGYGYETGNCMVKKFATIGTSSSLSLQQTTTGTFLATYQTYKIIVHGLPFEITSVELDDQSIEISQIIKEEDSNIQIIYTNADFRTLTLK